MATEGMDSNEVDELSGWAEALEEQKQSTGAPDSAEQGGPLRGSQQPQIIIIRAETEPGVVVRKIVDDYRSNGASRQVLRRDMLGEG